MTDTASKFIQNSSKFTPKGPTHLVFFPFHITMKYQSFDGLELTVPMLLFLMEWTPEHLYYWTELLVFKE